MKQIRIFMSTFVVVAVFAVAACSQDSGNEVSMSEPEPTPSATEPAEAVDTTEAAAPEVASSELAGTSWSLVRIMSMDDSVYEPEDPSRYTLEFAEDGSARVLADCNRGSGSFTSESAGQLQFGPIASTKMACPPESLGDKYMGQFEWVRSYVLKDGNLFLATMADGAIIEFEPAE